MLRNIGALWLAQILTMLLNVAALVHIARAVGETWFGVLQWAVVFSSYALVISEWGLTTLGVRDVARLAAQAPAEVRRYAATQLGLIMGLGVLVLAGGALLLPVFPLYRADPLIMLIYLATILPFAVSLDWVGIGLERLGTVSAVKTLRSLLYAAAVLALLPAIDGLAGWPAARWVPVFFFVAWLLAAVLLAWRVRRWLGGWVWPRLGPLVQWRRRLAQTAPLGAGMLTLRVLLNIDVMLLGMLAAPAVVGNYAAAAKIVFVLVIAVEVAWKALLPRLARAWQESPERCRRRFNLYLGLFLLAGLPVAVGGALAGGDVMNLLYGERFPDAGPVCRVLSVAYVALALGQFLGNGLIATDRQGRYFPPLVAAAAVAAAAVVLLAPRGGAIGVALAMLAAHGTLLAATAWAGRDLLLARVWRPIGAAAAGGLAMAGCLLLLAGLPLLPRLLLALAAYGVIAAAATVSWLREELRRTGL